MDEMLKLARPLDTDDAMVFIFIMLIVAVIALILPEGKQDDRRNL